MQWDDRLTGLGVHDEPNPSGVWELTNAQFEDENEAQGQHHIWFTVLDAQGKPRPGVTCVVDWVGRDPGDPPTRRVTDASGKANVDIYANLDVHKLNGPYFAFIDSQSESDTIAGMGLPEHHHVNYMLTFAPRAEPVVPPPTQTLEQTVLSAAKSVPWMPVNNGAALWNYAKALGLQDQQTDELTVTFNGNEYLLQVFNLGIVYCRKGDWGNIHVIRK